MVGPLRRLATQNALLFRLCAFYEGSRLGVARLLQDPALRMLLLQLTFTNRSPSRANYFYIFSRTIILRCVTIILVWRCGGSEMFSTNKLEFESNV